VEAGQAIGPRIAKTSPLLGPVTIASSMRIVVASIASASTTNTS
jgi:hypothetical protein